MLHLSHPEFSADNFAGALRVAQSAGLMVLYSGNALSEKTKHRLDTEFADRFFDLASAPELHVEEEIATRHVLALAQSLWLVEPRKNQEKVN